MTRTTYRTDWEVTDEDQNPVPGYIIDEERFDTDRRKACGCARRMSKRHGFAYVIISHDGKDVGSIYYSDGHRLSVDMYKAADK